MNLDINVMQTENGWFASATCQLQQFGGMAQAMGVQSVPNPEYERFKPRQAVFTSLEDLQRWINKVTREILSE